MINTTLPADNWSYNIYRAQEPSSPSPASKNTQQVYAPNEPQSASPAQNRKPPFSLDAAQTQPQNDSVTLSEEAVSLSNKEGKRADNTEKSKDEEVTLSDEKKKPNGEPLSDDEKQKVQQLQARDREVKQHEQAHKAAAGQYARGGSFDYQKGPDGVQYAVGGDVQIDVGRGRTPEETIQKARIVRQAALAPAQPSAQDRRVAASASAMESAAQKEIAEERIEKQEEESTKSKEATENNAEEAQEMESSEKAEPNESTASQSNAETAQAPPKTAPAAEDSTSPIPDRYPNQPINIPVSSRAATQGYSDNLPNPMNDMDPPQNSTESLQIAI